MGFNSGFKGLISSTCFEHYPAHLQEVLFLIVYMRSLVSSLYQMTTLFLYNFFYLFVLVYLPCLFSIANLDDWLTVHHSITFLSPTWCTNFLFIYILIKILYMFRAYPPHLQEVHFVIVYLRDRVYTITKWTSWRWAGYAPKHVEDFN